MREQTFYAWLEKELYAVRRVLVELFEKKDRLLYVEAPEIRRNYMNTIGVVEKDVLENEMEVSFLRRKVELIQTAINRREAIDLVKIEEQIEVERQQKISELETKDLTLKEIPELSKEESDLLQKDYRDITKAFHPSLNPDISDTERELYEKAVEAYKMQDVEEMKLIHDMLFKATDDMIQDLLKVNAGTAQDEDKRKNYGQIASELSTDYSLAKTLFDSFAPIEDDKVVLKSLDDYREMRKNLENEIEKIKSGFPFNAQETLNSPEKTEEYLAELRLRSKHGEAEKAELEAKIEEMTKGKSHA